MAELEIMSLKPKYYKLVMGNQQKYNPNFDSKLDEGEIGILLAFIRKSTPDDLVIEADKSKTVEAAKDLSTLAFKDLDLNEDGEVTEYEVNIYENYLQLKKIYEKNKLEFSEIRNWNITRGLLTSAGTIIGGVLGSELVTLKPNPSRFCKLLGIGALAGLVGGVLYGAFSTILPSKEDRKLMKSALKNEKIQIKELDEQYKHIEAEG